MTLDNMNDHRNERADALQTDQFEYDMWVPMTPTTAAKKLLRHSMLSTVLYLSPHTLPTQPHISCQCSLLAGSIHTSRRFPLGSRTAMCFFVIYVT